MKLRIIFPNCNKCIRLFSTNTGLCNDTIATNVVHPYIRLDNNLEFRTKLQESLSLRNNKENLEELYALFKQYKYLVNRKFLLSQKRESINKEIKISKSNNEIDLLKSMGKVTREEFKELSKQISDFERTMFPRILGLPNIVRNETKEQENVIKVFGEPSTTKYDHLDVGKNYGLLEFVNPYLYYFKKQAASYELMFSQYIINYFKKKEFVLFSCPDFSRDSLLNGFAKEDIKSHHLLTLDGSFSVQTDKLYLNGGAHFFPFCAFFLKTITDFKQLPLKCMSQGRHFSCKENILGGLYSVWQKTNVHVFINSSSSQCEAVFQETLDTVWDMFVKLNLPIKMSYCPVNELTPSESGRVSFKVYSPFHDKFVEVAHISSYNDYVSKRLRMYCKSNTEEFVHIVSGSIGNVPVLLATLFELGPDCSRTIENHLKLFSKS